MALVELADWPSVSCCRFQCFKSAWMTQVFHKGLLFPITYKKFTSAQLVNGKDVGWTLGALIYKTRFLPLR